jgi:hypothetical protein
MPMVLVSVSHSSTLLALKPPPPLSMRQIYLDSKFGSNVIGGHISLFKDSSPSFHEGDATPTLCLTASSVDFVLRSKFTS